MRGMRAPRLAASGGTHRGTHAPLTWTTIDLPCLLERAQRMSAARVTVVPARTLLFGERATCHRLDTARRPRASGRRSWWLAAGQIAGMTGGSDTPSGAAGEAFGGFTDAGAFVGITLSALFSAESMLSGTLEG